MTAQATMDDGLSEVDRRLKELVRASQADLYLVRLSDTRLIEASDSVLRRAQRTREQLLSMTLTDEVQDPISARKSFALMASGVIDSFTRHGAFRMPDGTFQAFTARYSTCTGIAPRTAAVGALLPARREIDLPAEAASSPVEGLVVLGTVDSEWRVDRVTSEISQVLDRSPEDVLCRSAFTLIHPEDVGTLLLLAAHAPAQAGGASGRVRVMRSDGIWQWCRLSVHALVGEAPSAFAFSLSGDVERPPSRGDRTQELEEHLRRIAREVDSSGVAAMSLDMPTAVDMPQISDLTAREYEIVVRLTRGERIAGIARALFLSESTVRNHLTSVYRKFGVASQGDLVELLHSAGAKSHQHPHVSGSV